MLEETMVHVARESNQALHSLAEQLMYIDNEWMFLKHEVADRDLSNAMIVFSHYVWCRYAQKLVDENIDWKVGKQMMEKMASQLGVFIKKYCK